MEGSGDTQNIGMEGERWEEQSYYSNPITMPRYDKLDKWKSLSCSKNVYYGLPQAVKLWRINDGLAHRRNN